jgi:hypothetical protein
MSINFKLIKTWCPNVVVASIATHKKVNFLTPPKAVSKKTLKIDSKSHDLFYKSQFQHLSEKRCVKKFNIDTTIDFVKNPKHSRNNTLLRTIPKNNLE